MIPINIFQLTRIKSPKQVQSLERQMSNRNRNLNVKEWEIEGLARLSAHLKEESDGYCGLKFFYSFMIPRIGKEFDLLRISDDYVVNIELKSGNVSGDTIKRQLIQNRYYLLSLGRSVRSYTYVSEEDKLYRLTKGDNLVESDFSKLCKDLDKQENCFEGNIEELFQESQYLISPLTDSDKFLNGEYFLTYQQRDIRNRIMQNIKKNPGVIQGFSGLPGTGKTLLLYDIAMKLSTRLRVCVLHFGFFPEELEHLNERLHRIDFYSCRNMERLPDMDSYSYILVDEGHHMETELLEELLEYNRQTKTPVIFAFDQEDIISEMENEAVLGKRLKEIPDFVLFNLTNRIRMNKELSSFIHSLIYPAKHYHKRDYPSVSIAYANDETELSIILGEYTNQGYVYIKDATNTTSKEFEKVVMVVDDSFYYDEAGYLRCKKMSTDETTEHANLGVRNLFHGLNRAKTKIAVIVYNSEKMIEEILSLL